MTSSSADKLEGIRLGPFHIVRFIGAGGMGGVYEAVHETIGYRAAAKVLGAQLLQDPKHDQYRARFLAEARAVNVISHPGIVRIFGFDETEDGMLYIMMELVEGRTLAERLSGIAQGRLPPLPLPWVLHIGRQVAQAMAQVHERGVVHRDLKPDNLMLVADPEVPSGERIKILDFGLARFLDSPERLTTAGMAVGTPFYMSPEQCLGMTPDGQTDVYSLGAILFQMLAGQPPFLGQGSGLLRKHIDDPPPPLERLAGELPAAVARLVQCMLEKQPADRPTMEEVAVRLAQLEQQLAAPPRATARSSAPNVDAGAPARHAGADQRSGAAPDRKRNVRCALAPPGIGLLVVGLLLGFLAAVAIWRLAAQAR